MASEQGKDESEERGRTEQERGLGKETQGRKLHRNPSSPMSQRSGQMIANPALFAAQPLQLNQLSAPVASTSIPPATARVGGE
ncbi:unnamed protein product [Lampetra planeri]